MGVHIVVIATVDADQQVPADVSANVMVAAGAGATAAFLRSSPASVTSLPPRDEGLAIATAGLA